MKLHWLLVLLFCAVRLPAQDIGLPEATPAQHFAYVDYQFIWTLEMIDQVPVVNIITFGEGEWPLRPQQFRIYNEQGQRARVEEFSMDTGTEPYKTPFFRVLGDSFIAIDLLGDFSGHQEPARVAVDLGRFRYHLKPFDLLAFESLVQKINSLNYESPDIREDYEVLELEQTGVRRIIPRR